MTEELVIREIRIDEAAGRGNSDSLMAHFEVIMNFKSPINYENPIVLHCLGSKFMQTNDVFRRMKNGVFAFNYIGFMFTFRGIKREEPNDGYRHAGPKVPSL